ncbi:MAG: SRPBCC family protein [Nitriliruptorales bacterium]|nr:SRPBCC family protein [Nitriliruptorales bacterium]
MELEHAFTVPIGIDAAWKVLNDIERVVPCMPGARLTGHDGDEFTGTVKVKVGPMEVTYDGTAAFADRDVDERRVVIQAHGDQQRGAGTADATITATMAEEAAGTKVTVNTELHITGRPAQFGRGVMADVGDKLLGQFADCLAEELSGRGAPEDVQEQERSEEEPETAAKSDVGKSGMPDMSRRVGGPDRSSDDAIDLLDVAGPVVAKRAAVLVAVFVLLFVIWRLLRGER